MADNKDIAVLAKKVYELSTLRLDEIDGRKWEALLIVNAVLSSATPDGIAKANADKEARWGDAIRKEGMLAAFHPKWLLRTDDGKPPAIKHALESALDNPNRDLRTRLQALQFIAPADREPLTDLVKALEADAYAGARGDELKRLQAGAEVTVGVVERALESMLDRGWLAVVGAQEPLGVEGGEHALLADRVAPAGLLVGVRLGDAVGGRGAEDGVDDQQRLPLAAVDLVEAEGRELVDLLRQNGDVLVVSHEPALLRPRGGGRRSP
jgi:hypothetical protein